MQITKKALIPMHNPKTMSIDAVEVENTFTGETEDEILEQISIYEIGLAREWQETMFSKFNINKENDNGNNQDA